ncbi:MAG: hypothetical protein LBG91_02170 [Treponema sp.]|nr:hypothetical protein [Treponema sp.]
MSAEKRTLIVTDGTVSIQGIAQSIADVLAGYRVKICPAQEFAGTDLLPAETFFLGCEEPHPVSFSYLAEMLEHINLAGRKCGIFSTNEKALEYLQELVKDSEAALGEPLRVSDEINAQTIKKWLDEFLK